MIVQDTMQYLSQLDPEVGASVQEEFARQQRNIELIASENIVSPAVMVAMGTCLTNKYAEGYPGHRYYGGCFAVDITEELARQRTCQLFGCRYANVQPHSGANANLAAFFALAQPGDTILGMNLAHGGHLSHGSPVNISGKYFHIVPYGLGEDETIDYDALLETAKACKPKLIIAGASAYPRAIDFAKFREVADAVGAYLMVDMAHIAGLVAAGLHPSPIPYADVVTTTTHKTLRGPRGGLILCNDEAIYKKINSAVFPGTQGGPLEHIIAAKAVCFGEALKPEFKAYAQQIVKNAKVLAEELVKAGLPSGLRRHGQPPAAWWTCGTSTSPARSLSGDWTRFRSPSTKTPSPMTRRSPLSPAASGWVLPPSPPVASRSLRWCRSPSWMGQVGPGLRQPAGSRSAARWMPSAASSPSTSKPGGSAVFFQHNPLLFL